MADELHTTIYDNTEAASDTREDDVDLNRLAQLTAWLVIRKKHFYPAKHRKWHDLLYAYCESLSGGMSVGTAHLFTVVSLLMKAHADDDPVLESTKRIVSLLERVILFPELAHFTDDVRVLLDEAKCQVVLQSYSAGSNSKEVLTVFSEYFDLSNSPSAVGSALHNLLRKRKSKANTADMDRFMVGHSLPKLKTDLIKFLNSVLTNFDSFQGYSNYEEYVVPQFRVSCETVMVAPDEEHESRQEGDTVEDEGKEEEGEEEEECEESQQDDEGEGVEGSVSGEQETEAERMEQDQEKEDQDEQNGSQEDDRNEVDGTESGIQTRSKKMRNPPSGEEVSWDSFGSVENTPPSHLPSKKSEIALRNRDSLIGQSPTKRTRVYVSTSRNAWSNTETENLLRGVKKYGVGKWATILTNYEFDVSRTSTSLKDKWRNLQGRRN